MKFAALGRTRWLLDAIVEAEKAGHTPVLLATAPAAPEYGVIEGDFECLSKKYKCPFLSGSSINSNEAVEALRRCGADVAISVNWPIIVGPKVLETFEHGVINAHAGDLPRYRGNACPNWAILNGEQQVVLTFHRMVTELDAGPWLKKISFPLSSDTYIGDVYAFLDEQMPLGFVNVLDGLDAGTLEPTLQSEDQSEILRCYPRRPEDGQIDWSEPALKIGRLVRASSDPFRGAFTWIGDSERLTIWRARVGRRQYRSCHIAGQVAEIRDDGNVAVLAAEGLLVLEEVQTENGDRCKPAQIIRSTRQRLGMPRARHHTVLDQ